MSTGAAHKQILDNFQAVVSTFSDFLTVAIHTILYERNIYPRASFLSARKYNYPVRQNRHPKVCQWIQDAVAAVEAELLKGTVHQTSLLIYSPTSNAPLERFVFRPSLPSVPYPERFTPFAPSPHPTSSPTLTDPASKPAPQGPTGTPAGGPSNPASSDSSGPAAAPPPIPLRKPLQAIHIEEQFRSTLSRLSNLHSSLAPLPEGCTFTLVVEIKEGAQVPMKHPTAWIVAEPGLQASDEGSQSLEESDEDDVAFAESKKGKDLGGVRTTAVRTIEEGAFGLEVWVEEGRGKMEEIERES